MLEEFHAIVYIYIYTFVLLSTGDFSEKRRMENNK